MSKTSLIVRNAKLDDVEAISHLVEKVYTDMPPYPLEMLRAQITHFPDGVFVAVLNDHVVGYSATIRTSGEKALKPHTWKEITGGGYGATHDPKGEYLYGYETCVDPSIRGYRIGQRLYNERKKLAKYLRLKGIIFAGRIPRLARKIKQTGSAENYVRMVQEGKYRDGVLSFQLRNGFEVLGVFQGYLPVDKESLGYAVHLIWNNPEYDPQNQTKPSSRVSSVRVATVQYSQRKISSFEEFEEVVKYFVDVVADYKSDFVLFPELFSLQLLSIENEEMPHHQAMIKMTEYIPRIVDMFTRFAVKYNVNIIGGSHMAKIDGDVQNVAYVFLRDGSVYEQPKVHPTPNERYWWKIKGGNYVRAIETDCCTIGTLVCYDSEFPELTRHLVNQGIKILFVPFLTDERQGYCRVRYCCQARAVENQIYVAMSGNVGNLPNVANMDIQYAQSCILTPCDFPFARDGIAADSTPNVEMVSFADLRLDTLQESRVSGTVQNLKDRRHDLYSVVWHRK